MTSNQAKQMSLIAGGVIVAGTLLRHHYDTTDVSIAGGAKETFSLGKALAPVGLLIIVMVITADLVPDFAGPLAILIMIAYISTHLDVFNEFANTSEGKKKK